MIHTNRIQKLDFVVVIDFEYLGPGNTVSYRLHSHSSHALDHEINEVVAHVCRTVYDIYKLPSVERYARSHTSGRSIARRNKVKSLTVKVNFDQFVDLSEKFELYSTLDQALMSNRDYEIVVMLNAKKNPGSGDPSIFYLALTNEKFEELKRFITEVEQQEMVNRLTL